MSNIYIYNVDSDLQISEGKFSNGIYLGIQYNFTDQEISNFIAYPISRRKSKWESCILHKGIVK